MTDRECLEKIGDLISDITGLRGFAETRIETAPYEIKEMLDEIWQLIDNQGAITEKAKEIAIESYENI